MLNFGKTTANIPFEIHTMDWIEKNRWQQNAVPHRHSYFVIIWVNKGAGVHLIDLERYEIADNVVYCLTPGQIHQLTPTGPTDGYVISFTPEFLYLAEDNFDLLFNTGLFQTFSHSPVIKVGEDMKHEMAEIVEKMIREYENFFLLRAEILRGFLKIFLIYLTRQFERSSHSEVQSKGIDLVKRFLSLLEKNYTEKRMVTDYAEALVVTPNYLNEIVKKVTGFPASHHIQQRIVLEAKRQAMYADVSMKEIAYQLGFDDVAHFSKFFKNSSGLNFTDFKKSQQAGKTGSEVRSRQT